MQTISALDKMRVIGTVCDDGDACTDVYDANCGWEPTRIATMTVSG